MASHELSSMDQADLAGWLDQAGEPPYRAGQILRWVHGRGARSFDDMTDVGSGLRQRLAGAFALARLEPLARSRAADGTEKLLFEVPGRGVGEPPARIESVLIPQRGRERGARDRLTLCISTQAGCGMGCTFCATATLGLQRNLSVGEIVGQVRAGIEVAAPHRLTNVVLMGMGEPLANWPAVRKALAILSADWGYGISPRRITVSTVGLAPLIPRVVEETGANLAVSLHATTDEQRARLVPITRRYPLAALIEACRAVPIPRRSRITFEYALLAGENDSEADARRLARLLHGIRSKVNLIPFNAFPGAAFRPTPRAGVLAFQRVLLGRGLAATIRETRGADIQAACGQLAAGHPRS